MSSLLGGVSPDRIPVAGAKRRSFGPQLGGQVYRIGQIWANRAFVVIRGNLRLLYVARGYRKYAAVARRVFDGDGGLYDYDHVLGRALCEQQGFSYILVTRLDLRANRSHGRLERPQSARRTDGMISLDKFCFADDRIFQKMLGIPYRAVSAKSRVPGYELVPGHERRITLPQAARLRHALGMGRGPFDMRKLSPINH